MVLTKIGQERIQDRAVSLLREAILDGTFAQGERLVEVDLAERLGISRGPVRDALQVLAAEGLVEVSPYKGATVRQLSPKDILEILDLRMLLEGYAARRAAESATVDEIADVRSIFNDMQEHARRGELNELVKDDIRFHEEVCRLSRNARLLQVWHLFAPQIGMFLTLSDKVYIDAQTIARLHTDEMDAIEARDPDRAEQAARASLLETAQIIMSKLQGE